MLSLQRFFRGSRSAIVLSESVVMMREVSPILYWRGNLPKVNVVEEREYATDGIDGVFKDLMPMRAEVGAINC